MTSLPGFDPATARALLHAMLRIRRFEETAAEKYTAGFIRGFLHLYIGEEAVAVGLMRNLGPDDAVVSTYREHGHALARGVSARSIMAEMYGKQEGCARGRGGSMHLFDADARFFGGNAIVAGGLPIAVGLALADALRGLPRVSVCLFGDGAVAEGEFHESMNLAALWQLPVLFVCENNGYAMGTALDRAEAETDLCRRAASYGIKARPADGMNVFDVEAAAREACAEIRATRAPQFLECRTYRFRAHSMFDPQLYREQVEVEAWKERGPIRQLEAAMRERGLLDDEGLAAIEAEIAAEIADALAFAEAGTLEPVEELIRFVYSEVRM